jgi:hypothetical protein
MRLIGNRAAAKISPIESVRPFSVRTTSLRLAHLQTESCRLLGNSRQINRKNAAASGYVTDT